MTASPVTVHCPSCNTAFPVDPAKVPAAGVHAACSQCGRVFLVEGTKGARDTSREGSGKGEDDGKAPGAPAGGVADGRGADAERPQVAGKGTGTAAPSGARAKGGSEGGSDSAAEEFEEWSSFQGLSFEEDEDGDEDGESAEASAPDQQEDGKADARESGAVGTDVESDDVEPDDDVRRDLTSSHHTAAGPDTAPGIGDTNEMDTAAAIEMESDIRMGDEDSGGEAGAKDGREGEPLKSGLDDEGASTRFSEEAGSHLADETGTAEGEATAKEVEASEQEGRAAGERARADAETEPADHDDAPPSAGDAAETRGPTVEAPTPATTAPSFGRRDPHERAVRLARVLASDMIAYNQEKYAQAVEGGTLASDFEEEVEKSWDEYVEQVGKEIAEGNSYFQDALNEILAQGQKVF